MAHPSLAATSLRPRPENMAIDYGPARRAGQRVLPGLHRDAFVAGDVRQSGYGACRERYRKEHRLGRFGRPDEIAGAALFLASSDASFVTGRSWWTGVYRRHACWVLEPLGL